MPFLTAEEITTHLYGEVSDEISRGDATKLPTAISAAQEEARGYLTMLYDVAAIFAATGDARNPILLLYIKDIAVWHYIQLANPAVDMELRLKRYEQAVRWLEKVQSGKTNPNLPTPAAPVNNQGQLTTAMKWGGNQRRNNYFN